MVICYGGEDHGWLDGTVHFLPLECMVQTYYESDILYRATTAYGQGSVAEESKIRQIIVNAGRDFGLVETC